jgi:threonine synthase
MNYTSTRNSTISLTAADTIVKGISEEGGLFVPQNLEALRKLTADDFSSVKSYQEWAFEVMNPLLGFAEDELKSCINKAYSWNFSTLGTTRVVKLTDNTHILELWHGPTAAFKDMALQILPGLLNASNTAGAGKTLILTATSGDTGKAALEGFADVDGIEIAVFYPEDGVSETQKLQMTTQEGENVHVFAVKGNFDDCQNAVKAVFTDSEVAAAAKKAGVTFSSANSINWGRLCPQIVYYVSAYAELVRTKAIHSGDKVNICVPTGNFGNILAAYYAMETGVPVNKLICASNTNKILTDFIETGVYDKNREFHTTVSPSMDILISSNLERLLYHLCGNNDSLINKWFASLNETGKFEVDETTRAKLQSLFFGGWCSEFDTALTVKNVYRKYGYLMDTHTAVGYKVLQDYLSETGDTKTKAIVAATASPYKFSDAVYESLFGRYVPEEEINEPDEDTDGEDCFEVNAGVMEALAERTGIRIPKPLEGICDRIVRFDKTLEKGENGEIKAAVLGILSP